MALLLSPLLVWRLSRWLVWLLCSSGSRPVSSKMAFAMISRVFRIFILLVVATTGSLSIAADRLYSGMTQTGWTHHPSSPPKSDPLAACKVPWSSTAQVVAQGNPPTAYACYDGFAFPYWYLYGYVGAAMMCPDLYTRDSTKPDTSPEACYFDSPPDPCEENEGVQSSSTFYQGDTSSSGGGGAPYVPPTVVCLGQCRSVFSGADECYSRAYVAGDPKFGQHAVFCKANYIGIAAQCETGDATSAGNASPSAPDPAANPPAPEAPDCPAGTYAVKSGSQWICNSQDAPHPSPDEEGCPPGTSPGTMDGQNVCAPASGNQNTAPTGSGTPGSGGANGSGNGSGSGTTGAGGEGAGAQGATADTGGAVGGSADTKGVGQTSVGVDCGTPPVCSGDPLLCGIQLQEFESACAVQNVIGSPLPEDELEKWQAVGVEVDSPAVDTALSRASQKLEDFSSRLSFQTSGCPADFSISVLGRSIPIAISSACSLLQLMKMILFMGAYLFSLRVLWSSVL